MLPPHHILVWTRQRYVSDVLELALGRLGYSSAILTDRAQWPAYVARARARATLLIFGPHVSFDEIAWSLGQFHGLLGVRALFLTYSGREVDINPYLATSARAHNLLMPLDLVALDQMIRALLDAAAAEQTPQ